MPEKKTYIIDGRRSSIYFFSVLYLMMLLVIVMLLFPTFPYWNQLQYMHFYFLIPVVILKVGFPNTKLAKWLATSVVLFKFKK